MKNREGYFNCYCHKKSKEATQEKNSLVLCEDIRKVVIKVIGFTSEDLRNNNIVNKIDAERYFSQKIKQLGIEDGSEERTFDSKQSRKYDH